MPSTATRQNIGEDSCALPENVLLGTLARVQATLVHGVAIVVETANGRILVPLDAHSQEELQEALNRARLVDDSVMGMISSLSLH